MQNNANIMEIRFVSTEKQKKLQQQKMCSSQIIIYFRFHTVSFILAHLVHINDFPFSQKQCFNDFLCMVKQKQGEHFSTVLKY